MFSTHALCSSGSLPQPGEAPPTRCVTEPTTISWSHTPQNEECQDSNFEGLDGDQHSSSTRDIRRLYERLQTWGAKTTRRALSRVRDTRLDRWEFRTSGGEGT